MKRTLEKAMERMEAMDTLSDEVRTLWKAQHSSFVFQVEGLRRQTFDVSLEKHEELLRELWRETMGEEVPAMRGKHWGRIGFQVSSLISVLPSSGDCRVKIPLRTSVEWAFSLSTRCFTSPRQIQRE